MPNEQNPTMQMEAKEALAKSDRIFCRIENGQVVQTEWTSDDVEPMSSVWANCREVRLGPDDNPGDTDSKDGPHMKLLGRPADDPKLKAVVRKPRFILTIRQNTGEEVEVGRVKMNPGEQPEGVNPKFGVYRVKEGAHPSKADFKNAQEAEPMQVSEPIMERHRINFDLDIPRGADIVTAMEAMVAKVKNDRARG